MTPNKFVLSVVVNEDVSDQEEGTAVPALRARRFSIPFFSFSSILFLLQAFYEALLFGCTERVWSQSEEVFGLGKVVG